jgi:hypothetical protein
MPYAHLSDVALLLAVHVMFALGLGFKAGKSSTTA